MAAISIAVLGAYVCPLPAVGQTPVAKAPLAKAADKAPAVKKPAAKPQAKAAPPVDEVDPGQMISDTVTDIAGWVVASGDNQGLPFAVVDKEAAQVLVFDAKGKLKGLAPTLLGSAVGDESAPGVGDRELSDIPAGDRTTPAGRFLAGFGPAAGGERVLWIDYATAISIHAMPQTKTSRKEKRKERLTSATPSDNRITHGCINVSSTFYKTIITPIFARGGMFYVLPDSTPLTEAFPSFELANRIASAEPNTSAAPGVTAR